MACYDIVTKDLTYSYNFCPEGSTCASIPPHTASECAAGRYCTRDTVNGGERCPTGVRPTYHVLPWELTAYCKPGLRTGLPYGKISLPELIQIGGWGELVCPEGSYCPDNAQSIPCPAGYFCEVGVSEPAVCSSDWWYPSAEERCPEGSSKEPGINFTYLIYILVPLVFLIMLCELLGWLLRCMTRMQEDTSISHDERARKHRETGKAFLRSARKASKAKEKMDIEAGTDSSVRTSRISLTDEKSSFKKAAARATVPPSPIPSTTTKLRGSFGHSASATSTVEQSMSGEDVTFGKLMVKAQGLDVRGDVFIEISIEGLDFYIGRNKVLKNVHADVSHGELVALMGESGSGKSTLLNILGGRASYGRVKPAAKGGEHPMRMNGEDFWPHKHQALIGFVPQAHIVFKELTVYENLLYASQMRAGTTVPLETRLRLIEFALDLLVLQECRHFVCDPSLGERLSGGQMRRIGIAIELVCDQPIMLLDEPTSALDAVNTELVATAMKSLASRGILIIASLHQPRERMFKLFDKLWMMRAGELTYGGAIHNAVPFYAKHGFEWDFTMGNPADFFVEVCFGMVEPSNGMTDAVEKLGERWRETAKKEQERRRARRKLAQDLATLTVEDRQSRRKEALLLWVNRGDDMPLDGRELHNQRLSDAIGERRMRRPDEEVVFTPEEYNSLGVEEEVLAGDFVRSGHSYYQPDNQRLLKVTQKMSYIDFQGWWRAMDYEGIMSEDLKQQLWQEACRRTHAGGEGVLSVLWHSVRSEGRSTASKERRSNESRGSSFRSQPDPDHNSKPLSQAERSPELRSVERSEHSSRDGGSPASVSFSSSTSTALVRTMGRTLTFSNLLPHAILKTFTTEADLLSAKYNFQIARKKLPGWRRHFVTCTKRGLLKLVRKRRQLYSKWLMVLFTSTICGLIVSVIDDRNLYPILYMLCNSIYATVVATSSIEVMGSKDERELIAHEAASGIRMSAEAISRILLDLLVAVPLAPVFTFPLIALSKFPVGAARLTGLYALVSWAMATVGYICSMLLPHNSTMLTTALTLISFAFLSGPLVGPAFLPDSMKWIFELNPGYNAFMQLGFGNAVQMPFSVARWRLTNVLMMSKMLPEDIDEIDALEQNEWLWLRPSIIWMLGFGAVTRVIAVVVFVLRDASFYKFKAISRWCAKRFRRQGTSVPRWLVKNASSLAYLQSADAASKPVVNKRKAERATAALHTPATPPNPGVSDRASRRLAEEITVLAVPAGANDPELEVLPNVAAVPSISRQSSGASRDGSGRLATLSRQSSGASRHSSGKFAPISRQSSESSRSASGAFLRLPEEDSTRPHSRNAPIVPNRIVRKARPSAADPAPVEVSAPLVATDGDEPTVIEVSLDLRSSGRDRLAEAGAADDDGAGVMLGGARRSGDGRDGIEMH